MALPLLCLFAVPVFFQSTQAFNCGLPPVYVDIHKRAVHGSSVFQYGSFIGVGSPAQNQSLWPSLRQNHTSVAWVNFCDNSDVLDCKVSTRGNFNPVDSQTWREDKNFVSLDIGKTSNNTMFGQDLTHLYTHYFETDGATQTLVQDTTLSVEMSGSEAPGIVGLGTASTLMQKMYNDNIVAGRTYSVYVGSGMDRAAGVINGSIVFGGYDSGRFIGDVHNYSMEFLSSEPFAVQVQDIILNDPTGLVRNVSLFDPTEFPSMKNRPDAFTAKLTTDQYPMSFPYQITQNFMSRLAAVPSDYSDGSLKISKPFNGTMTIVLSDGFKVDIPNNVLYNVSGISPVADREQNSTSPFYLSTSFLSQVYLMVDLELYSFHLAKAIAEQNYVMPKTFCPKSVPVPYAKPNQSSFNKQGLVGAVIASVIGGLTLISLSFFGLVWFLRRREANKMQRRDSERGKAKMAKLEVDDSGSEEVTTQPKKSRFWRRGS